MSSIKNLLNQNKNHNRIFKLAGELGHSFGLKTFLVGGYIRDLLMNKTANDIDIVVEKNGISFAKKLSKILKSEGFVAFEKFGTAQLSFNNLKIEISTARSETYLKNSRKPLVVFSDINDDLSRRDFTVNSIAVSILHESYGQIFDPFNAIFNLNPKTPWFLKII